MFRKLFVLLMAVLVLTACNPVKVDMTPTAQPTLASITLTDGLGRTVSLPAPAQRVVSLAPSNTEILFAVGAGAQVVGRDMFSDYPAEAASVQDIGGSMGEYNLEAIVALQPDLVLAGGINPPELVASLEGLGLTVYFLPNPATLEEMYANLETVGALTGRGSEAAALVESLTARVAAVDAVILPLSYRPTVYYEIDATNPASPYTYGPGTFGDLLIQRAGGFNIGSQLEGQWATISLEKLVADNPSIVLLGDAAWGETPEKFAARPGMDALDAVKNGQVYPFDDNLVSRPGPRLVDGLEALAKLLHPGLFK
ncbi:MAG: iron complex transport system substrate-binding protein [Anaerolineaceae bacterium]|nr:MAG: iron complex transport system substrate-binding protein [Anaerolineaceae bacterium]